MLVFPFAYQACDGYLLYDSWNSVTRWRSPFLFQLIWLHWPVSISFTFVFANYYTEAVQRVRCREGQSQVDVISRVQRLHSSHNSTVSLKQFLPENESFTDNHIRIYLSHSDEEMCQQGYRVVKKA